MSDTLERYRNRFAPKKIRTRTGTTWWLKRMQAGEWGTFTGGLLTFEREQKNGSEPAPRTVDQEVAYREEYRRLVYENLAIGLGDDETGELLRDADQKPIKLRFEEVDPLEITDIVAWHHGDLPNSEEKAELAGRSLQ